MTDFKQLLCDVVQVPATSSDVEIANAAHRFQQEMVAYATASEDAVRVANQKAEDLEKSLANSDAANKTRVTELESKLANATRELANHDADKFASIIVNRDVVIEQLIANRDATLKFLASIKNSATEPAPVTEKPSGELKNAKKQDIKTPVHNPANAALPNRVELANADGCTPEQAKVIANRAQQLRAANPRLGFTKSFTVARAELSISQ